MKELRDLKDFTIHDADRHAHVTRCTTQIDGMQETLYNPSSVEVARVVRHCDSPKKG